MHVAGDVDLASRRTGGHHWWRRGQEMTSLDTLRELLWPWLAMASFALA